ncbi:Chitin synthase [Binucleata daphniae]
MDIFNLKHTCTEVDLPFCKVLHDTPTEYAGRTTKILATRVSTPYTVLLLVTVVLFTIRMLKSVNTHYSAVGRKEMKTFFYLYIIAIIIDIVLISNVLEAVGKNLHLILVCLQLGFVGTSVFCLFIGSVTTVCFFTYSRFSSTVVTRIASTAYFIAIVSCLYVTLATKNSTIFFVLIFPVNLLWLFCYTCFQLYMMRQINSEVWAYGTLFIAGLFFFAGCIPLFFGCKYIATLSERYLDGLFFVHLLYFCAIIMIHKFWLSVCDDEVECTPMIIKNSKFSNKFLLQ